MYVCMCVFVRVFVVKVCLEDVEEELDAIESQKQSYPWSSAIKRHKTQDKRQKTKENRE